MWIPSSQTLQREHTSPEQQHGTILPRMQRKNEAVSYPAPPTHQRGGTFMQQLGQETTILRHHPTIETIDGEQRQGQELSTLLSTPHRETDDLILQDMDRELYTSPNDSIEPLSNITTTATQISSFQSPERHQGILLCSQAPPGQPHGTISQPSEHDESTSQSVTSFDMGRKTKLVCIGGLGFAYLSAITFLTFGIVTYVRTKKYAMVYPENIAALTATELPSFTAFTFPNIGHPMLFYPNNFLFITDKTKAMMISLALNLLVFVHSETLTIIHDTNLRWLLLSEGRLKYHSNTRFFTTTRRFWPHRWYINVLWGLCKILCATGVSQIMPNSDESFFGPGLIQPQQEYEPEKILCSFNGLSMAIVGISLLLQCFIVTWGIILSPKQTWNSNPLNTALAAMLESKISPSTTTKMKQQVPRREQPSLFRSRRSVKYIVLLLWTIIIGMTVVAVWALLSLQPTRAQSPITWGNSSDFKRDLATRTSDYHFLLDNGIEQYSTFPSYWNPLPGAEAVFECSTALINRRGNESTMSYIGPPKILNRFISNLMDWLFYMISHPAKECLVEPNQRFSFAPYVSFFFVAGLQSAITLIVYSAELVPHAVQDERVWRRAAHLANSANVPASGAAISAYLYGPAGEIAASATIILIFLLRSVITWVFGMGVSITMLHIIKLQWVPLLILAGDIFLLGLCVCHLAIRHPKGPQPATYGDVRKLVQLVDDWGTGAGDRLFWGDKGGINGIRVVGTVTASSCMQNGPRSVLSEVRMDGTPYMGLATFTKGKKAGESDNSVIHTTGGEIHVQGNNSGHPPQCEMVQRIQPQTDGFGHRYA